MREPALIRLAAVLSALAGLSAGIAPSALAQDMSPEREAELHRFVRQDCGSCHGLTLKGGLGPDLRAETLDGAAPEALASIILDGVPGTAMPPWRPLLTEEEAAWIARNLLDGRIAE